MRRELPSGDLPALVLAVLSKGPSYGYAIAREVELLSDQALHMREGSLYPALRVLETEGLILGEWAPQPKGADRKVYTLTEAGRKEMVRRTQELRDYATVIHTVLGRIGMHGLPEEYLAEVSAQMIGMPASRRAEELREMRVHLEDAVAVGVERGASEEDAARQAVRQFGSPEAIAAEEISAWRGEQKAARRNLWKIVVCYLGCSYLEDLITLVQNFLTGAHHPYDIPVGGEIVVFAIWPTIASLILVVIVSAVFPRQAFSGLAAAMTAKLVLFTIPILITSCAPPYSHHVPSFPLLLLIGLVNLIQCAAQFLAASLGIRLRRSRSGRVKSARA